MKKLLYIPSLLIIASMILTACGGGAVATAAPASPPTAQVIEKTVVQTQIVEVTPMPGPNAEAVIQGVEPNAEITFWTFWLSPTFDDYIKDTIARFQEAYPGVKVNWEDHQATFQDDLKNAFAAGNAPDVINLSVSEGWVSDYATQGLLLPLDDKVPQDVKDLYFPGLWQEQLVDGVNYQFPWYQGISVNLINTQLYSQTGLTVNDLLAQMVYEGGVKVISDDGKTFTFDSPDGVAWLQMYVDMVAADTVDKTVL